MGITMRSPLKGLISLVALPMAMAACSAEPVAPPAQNDSPAGATILTSFDRLTLAPGNRTSFRASLVSPGARLASAGLAFVSRSAAIARVSGEHGRAEVESVSAGRTWIVVASGGAADSVEVIVQ
jgi:hypothetical protein